MRPAALFLQSAGILCLAVITAPSAWLTPVSRHSRDSYFTLSTEGQLGLAILSLALALILIALALVKSHLLLQAAARRGRSYLAGAALFDGSLGLLMYYLFIWLSPQIYYLYYLALFDSLSLQWVTGGPPSLAGGLDLLVMQQDANLADVAQGILGHSLLLVTPLVAVRTGWRTRASHR